MTKDFTYSQSVAWLYDKASSVYMTPLPPPVNKRREKLDMSLQGHRTNYLDHSHELWYEFSGHITSGRLQCKLSMLGWVAEATASKQ